MMSRLIATIACVLLLAGPAHASEARDSAQRVPAMFDLGTRIVFGIPLTILGCAAMIPVGFLTAITRPTEIEKPFRYLVVAPARYTWADPLGDHPDPAEFSLSQSRDSYVSREPSALPPGSTPSGD
jgi:hypothetical protein